MPTKISKTVKQIDFIEKYSASSFSLGGKVIPLVATIFCCSLLYHYFSFFGMAFPFDTISNAVFLVFFFALGGLFVFLVSISVFYITILRFVADVWSLDNGSFHDELFGIFVKNEDRPGKYRKNRHIICILISFTIPSLAMFATLEYLGGIPFKDQALMLLIYYLWYLIWPFSFRSKDKKLLGFTMRWKKYWQSLIVSSVFFAMSFTSSLVCYLLMNSFGLLEFTGNRLFFYILYFLSSVLILIYEPVKPNSRNISRVLINLGIIKGDAKSNTTRRFVTKGQLFVFFTVFLIPIFNKEAAVGISSSVFRSLGIAGQYRQYIYSDKSSQLVLKHLQMDKPYKGQNLTKPCYVVFDWGGEVRLLTVEQIEGGNFNGAYAQISKNILTEVGTIQKRNIPILKLKTYKKPKAESTNDADWDLLNQ